MPLINNDKLGRRIVRIGYAFAFGALALAILAVLTLIVTLALR